ncbi:MAG: hypothetical protein IJU79_02165 [Desulfovibrionaceae bacterium]|nr:hypothetical protein [Desulfovibrionaceae bacterium]
MMISKKGKVTYHWLCIPENLPTLFNEASRQYLTSDKYEIKITNNISLQNISRDAHRSFIKALYKGNANYELEIFCADDYDDSHLSQKNYLDPFFYNPSDWALCIRYVKNTNYLIENIEDLCALGPYICCEIQLSVNNNTYILFYLHQKYNISAYKISEPYFFHVLEISDPELNVNNRNRYFILRDSCYTEITKDGLYTLFSSAQSFEKYKMCL